MRDVPVVAGGAGRGAAGLSAVLREGRGGSRAVHGVERTVAHTCNYLPALVEVGEAISERPMHIRRRSTGRAGRRSRITIGAVVRQSGGLLYNKRYLHFDDV